MLWRVRNSRGRPLNAPAAFILPCQPIVARQPPSGETGVKIAEKHPPSKKDIRLSISVHSYPLGGWREPLSSIRWRRLLRCGSGGDNWDKLSLSLETDRRYFISGISFQHHRPKYCLQASVTERPIALPPVPSQGVSHAASHHFRSDAAGRTTTMSAVRSANASFADRTN